MQPHGDFQIRLAGQVVISALKGAWNAETAHKYFDEVRDCAREICHNPWARLVDLSEWEGSGDDVAQILVNLQQWSAEHNSKYVAYVKPHTLSRYMMEKYNVSDVIDYSVFDDHQSALAFLTQCLSNEKS